MISLIPPILERFRSRPQGERFVLGVVGPPACGKSTIAGEMVRAINEEYGREVAAICGMDAYHRRNAELINAGLHLWKGCHFTFDAAAYLEKLQELKREAGTAISCPIYDRSRSIDPIPDGQIITPDHQLVITEGNYLLMDIGPWSQIRNLLDYSIYLNVDDEIQLTRLMQRHQKSGRSQKEALAKAQSTDLPNTIMVRRYQEAADLRHKPVANFPEKS